MFPDENINMSDIKIKQPTCKSRRNHKPTINSNATIQNYKLLKTIGKGLYSKVKLAADKNKAKFYAIKIIKRHHVEKVSLKIFK